MKIMNTNDCFYCTKDERLQGLMIKICDMPCATFYLFKDQRYTGRCVLAFNDHKEEFFELTQEERSIFSESMATCARVLKDLFHADKIYYAVYGDLVSHFHVHLVPKFKDGPEWGGPFTDTNPKTLLTDEAYDARIQLIKDALANSSRTYVRLGA